MIYFLTGALAFAVNVAILIWAARWLAVIYRSRLIAILGTVFVGVVLSVVADFTVAYSVDGYDRSIKAIIERGTMSGLQKVAGVSLIAAAAMLDFGRIPLFPGTRFEVFWYLARVAAWEADPAVTVNWTLNRNGL